MSKPIAQDPPSTQEIRSQCIPSRTRVGSPKIFISYSLNISPEVERLLADMAAATGDDEADVIRKAIGLYKLAIDARQQGLTVGAVRPDQDMEVEFVVAGSPSHAG